MKKKSLLVLLGLIAAVAVSGCGNSKEKETEASVETTEDAAVLEEETAAEPVVSLDPITPSDYLVKDIADYVTLGDVSDLAVTQYNYEVTDEMVQERIDMELSSYAEEKEVDRESKTGDVIYADITSTVQGDEDSEYTESTYITLGDEEYSAEFDEQLTGVSAGDTLEFSLDFDEDIWMEEWMNQTVDFKVEVTSVCEVETPEYNDDFVSENTEFTTVDEFETAMRDTLETEYAETSYMDTVETLFQSIETTSVFSGYPEDLYDVCKEEVLSFYASFADTTDEQEIYDLFDITEEDIDAEVVAAVNRRLLSSAICEEYDLEVTEDEYVSYVSEYAVYYGYDDVAQFEADNSRTTLVWSLFEAKAGDYLYENADISEETYVDEIDSDDVILDEIDLSDIDFEDDAYEIDVEDGEADDTDAEDIDVDDTDVEDIDTDDIDTEDIDANDADTQDMDTDESETDL